MARRRNKDAYIPNYELVTKYGEYWRFIHWIATPTPLRKPSTQKELSKEIGVNETTLGRWRRMPEFKNDVFRVVADNMADETADVMYSLRNKIFKEGNAAEVKLFLEWVAKWVPTIKLDGVIPELSPETNEVFQRLAKEFETKVREELMKKPT